MKAHIEPKSRECPFCGAPTYEVVSVTGMKCVRCTNKKNCGASAGYPHGQYLHRRFYREVLPDVRMVAYD